MYDPNITMEEYIRLEEEKAQKRGKVFNWKTAKYGKIWNGEDIYDLRSVETEFPAIAFNDELSSKTLSREPTVSSLNDEIDFRVSFDDSDDEDYTPTVSYLDDLDFFKEFENEFSSIVYNDAQTSKSDLLTEPILSPRHINEFDLNDEISVSEYGEEEQNILYFNDLFPFNIIHPDDLKSEKDNDNNEIDIIQSSKGNEITHGSNVLSKTSHDKITKTFRTGSFVINLNVNIAIWNYYANGMLFYLIMNLYVSFGIPFDPKRYYKDGDCAIMLWRPRSIRHMAPLPPREQRHPFLSREIHRVQVVDFQGMPELMRDGLFARMVMEHRNDAGVVVFTSRAWGRLFDTRGPLVWELILEFLSTLRFGKSESERMIPGKGNLHDYWRSISTDGDFLGPPYSYTLIRDPMLRLCHRMMAHSIAGRSQAPEKVTVTDLFYLRGLDVGSVNIPYLLARYLSRFAAGRTSRAHISGGQFVARLAKHFGLLTIYEQLDDTWAWVSMGPERQPDAAAGTPGVAQDAPVIDEGGQADPTHVQASPPPPAAARTMPQRMAILEEDVHEIRGTLAEQREVTSAMAHDFSRLCTWTTTSLARMMDRNQAWQTLEAKNIDEYWWRIYKSGDHEVLES
ncbi:hypothetical protein Tco_1318790 [Tanacetum coccineum]